MTANRAIAGNVLKANGYTLLQLLCAIGIMAVLTVLLVAVVKSKYGSAHLVKCSSNLREVWIAAVSFGGDHNGKFPARIEPDPDNPGLHLSGTYWHQVLRRGGYFGPPPREVTGEERMAVQRQGVHFCPQIPSSGTSDEAYGMRRWRTPGLPIDTSQNLNAVQNPADFFLLADSYMVAWQKQGYSLGTGLSSWRIRFSHDGKANTLFADGHVALMDRAYFDQVPVKQAEYGYTAEPYAYWFGDHEP